MLATFGYLKILVDELREGNYFSGATGATTRGLPYYVDDSDALQALTNAVDAWGKMWGIGTGRTGELQFRGSMRGLGAMSAGVQFVQSGQTIGTGFDVTKNVYPVGIVRANATGTLHLDCSWLPPMETGR